MSTTTFRLTLDVTVNVDDVARAADITDTGAVADLTGVLVTEGIRNRFAAAGIGVDVTAATEPGMRAVTLNRKDQIELADALDDAYDRKATVRVGTDVDGFKLDTGTGWSVGMGTL